MTDATDKPTDAPLSALADAFVNGFVNLGSLHDTLFSKSDEAKEVTTTQVQPQAQAKPKDGGFVVTQVKDAGIMSAIGTLGLIHMWNFGECWSAVQEYYSTVSGYSKAGACIALGMSSSGVWNENDPLLALLEESIKGQECIGRLGASIGLGLAYAGSSRRSL